MAISCFQITIQGLDVRNLKRFLEPAVECIPGNESGRALHLSQLYPEINQDVEHGLLWLDTGKRHWESILENECFEFSPDGSVLTIRGECHWAPPVEFVARLARMFPALSFEYGATTNQELHERWRCCNGANQILEACLTNHQTGEETWYVRNGEILDTKWDLSTPV